MNEKPVLFGQQMLRAILGGQKTQTRRVVKPQPPTPEAVRALAGIDYCWLPPSWPGAKHHRVGGPVWAVRKLMQQEPELVCPFGKPGDRLWVRETTVNVEEHGYIGPVYAESDEGRALLNYGLAPAPDDCVEVEPHELTLRPSIHMPRSMCRLVLEITAVRVERLQAITEADAVAEGLSQTESGSWLPGPCDHPEWAFHQLWSQVYGEPAWEANPWVWVIEFKRVEVAGG